MSDLAHWQPRDAPPSSAVAPRAADRGERVVAARGLVRRYRMGPARVEVLRGVDLDLHAGETVAVMGRSGAGKSTLLHQLGLLDRPDAGTLELHGADVTRLGAGARATLRNRHIGFVFQFYHLIPELDALENALLPLRIRSGFPAWLRRRNADRARATELLVELGLADRLTHRPAQLSGGERQRVAIARALVTGPRLLLCDEPTGNLDERTAESVVEQLFGVVGRRELTVVLVTHDAELAARADRVLTLHDGRLDGATAT